MFRRLRPQRVFRLRSPVCNQTTPVPRQGWWANLFFLKSQWPKNLESRNHPGHRPYLRITLMPALQPLHYASHGLAQKRCFRLRTIQTPRPATHRRAIGDSIRILQFRYGLLPRTVLLNASPQCFTAGQQTVMCVRKRKQRQECDRLPALQAQAPPQADPVVVCVVGLLPPPPVPNDRILFANRTSA